MLLTLKGGYMKKYMMCLLGLFFIQNNYGAQKDMLKLITNYNPKLELIRLKYSGYNPELPVTDFSWINLYNITEKIIVSMYFFPKDSYEYMRLESEYQAIKKAKNIYLTHTGSCRDNVIETLIVTPELLSCAKDAYTLCNQIHEHYHSEEPISEPIIFDLSIHQRLQKESRGSEIKQEIFKQKEIMWMLAVIQTTLNNNGNDFDNLKSEVEKLLLKKEKRAMVVSHSKKHPLKFKQKIICAYIGDIIEKRKILFKEIIHSEQEKVAARTTLKDLLKKHANNFDFIYECIANTDQDEKDALCKIQTELENKINAQHEKIESLNPKDKQLIFEKKQLEAFYTELSINAKSRLTFEWSQKLYFTEFEKLKNEFEIAQLAAALTNMDTHVLSATAVIKIDSI